MVTVEDRGSDVMDGVRRGPLTLRRSRVSRDFSLGDLRIAGLDDPGAAIQPDEPFLAAATTADETAAILFTSGSTGPPKGVVYTHGIFVNQVKALGELYAIEPGEIDLCTFPLFALFAPALGMTSIVPEMDATRPADVDPSKILHAIESFGASNLFGSPALIRRVGEYGAERGVKLPSLRRVISAGAPVPSRVLERFATMLSPGVQIFTPYGATESLPVASIGSDEILGETRHATDRGAGVCVGRPATGMRVEVIAIDDEPIVEWSDELLVPDGTIGEIAVQGTVVTRSYFNRFLATRLAKIGVPFAPLIKNQVLKVIGESTGLVLHKAGPTFDSGGPFWHRMGDLGYRDEQGRIWFCGRKAHRVITADGTLYTIPCEAVFNTHPRVNRTALVGIGTAGQQRPVLCVEPNKWPISETANARSCFDDLKAIGRDLSACSGRSRHS